MIVLADNHVCPRLEPLAAKVPEITIGFWVLKLLTTAIGEAASDYLLSTMSFVGFGIGVAGFVSTLWIQFRTRRYNAFAYSAAVMMVAVFGTMAADVIHHQLGVSFTMSTLFCALGVAATFWAWHRIENTLSVHSIATRRKPTKTGGLDYGDGPVAAGLLMTALVVVTYVAVRNRRMVTKPVPAQLKSAA